MFTLNYYKNLKTPLCLKTITVPQYVELIKSGYEVENILKAQVQKKGALEYDRIKAKRPCVTFNFFFNNYKENKNIQSPTGLLYFDIDVECNSVLSQLDYNKIHIAHKSFGGQGTCIVVKASDISEEYFKYQYNDIAKELGILEILDTAAVKKTQSTVLSYDTNIYYNENSYTFTSDKKGSFRRELRGEESISVPNDTFLAEPYLGAIRTTNAADFVPQGKEYEVFPEGKLTAQLIIPRKISKGSRNHVLLAQLNNLVSLNPLLTEAQVLQKAFAIHNINTNDRLTPNEVSNAVKSIMKYLKEGTLKPINNKIRKVIFSTNCELTKGEKIAISNKLVGKIRTDNTKDKISKAITGWGNTEKITAEAVAKTIGMSHETVKRHWAQFKQIVKDLNDKRQL